MPYIKINEKGLYYESYGQGEPLILLNGIMMSTASWSAYVNVFSRKYNLILVDFFDQGKSDKMNFQYTQMLQVDTLYELVARLDLENVNMMGISYGGEAALQYAIKYGESLKSLMLFNTTAYTPEYLRDIGDAWDKAARTYDGSTFFKATIPYIYSHEFYEENIKWLREREKLFSKTLTKDWYDGFIRLDHSADSLDVRDELHKIKVPALVVGSEYDTLLPVRFQEQLSKGISGSKFVVIKGSGHASMYEKPCEFASLVMGFPDTCSESFNVL